MSESTTRVIASGDALLGSWQLLRFDAPLEIQPGTRMHFALPERLEYTIPTADGALYVSLRWRVEDGQLHTMHEDGTNPVQVAVWMGLADILTFDFGGPRALFVRAT
ncbi:MAG TPA: hypothetical protein VE861_01835 [Gemmatimonadaceae bacterium]|nr:hypothetical protein [Gemmatimonadaceae bacterium]